MSHETDSNPQPKKPDNDFQILFLMRRVAKTFDALSDGDRKMVLNYLLERYGYGNLD